MQRSEIKPLSTQDFLQVVKSGDEKVLKKLYAGLYGRVEQYVRNNSGTGEDAKDIYQEAFLAVWRNISLGRFAPGDENAFSAYLFQVAKFKWIDRLRAIKGKQVVDINEEQLGERLPDPATDEEEDYMNLVRSELTRLGSQCRELLNRFYFRQQSLREIATHFSWTEASAKNNKYRCLQQLRNFVRQKIQNDIP